MPYTDVQFIGYAVKSSGVKNPKNWTTTAGAWFVSGDYCGTPPDPKTNSEHKDIENRLSVMEAAIKTAVGTNKVDKSATTLKVFVSPEFFFRGTRGAYEMDDYQKAIEALRALAKKYDEHWVFCFGSILGMCRDYEETLKKLLAVTDKDPKAKPLVTAEQERLVKELKKKSAAELPAYKVVEAIGALIQANKIADPKVSEDIECYNVVLVQRGSKGESDSRSIVKEFKSTVDFTIWDDSGLKPKGHAFYDVVKHVPTEPTGEGKEVQFKNYDGRGVFKLADVTFGVEICLDHHAQVTRLKKSGAKVQVQLVPSCGMDLNEPSLVAIDGGYAFNTDGAAPRTRLWKVKGGKKESEIDSEVEAKVNASHAATHLGVDGGAVHVYPKQALPAMK